MSFDIVSAGYLGEVGRYSGESRQDAKSTPKRHFGKPVVSLSLREYQVRFKADIIAGWNEGARYVAAVLPTGGGKTRVFSSIIHDHNGLSCAIAHRQELVGQISLSLAREGVYHRLVAPKNVIAEITADHRSELGRSFYNPNAPAAVAGVDTLVSRKEELAAWAAQITLVTIDECHHVLRENKWGTGVEMFPNAVGLGVTASPKRADGKGLSSDSDGVFDCMVEGPTTRELIELGYLTDFDIVVPASDLDVSSLQITASGDFSPKQLREASKNSHIVGDVVEQYLKFAAGKQGITFATDVETANEMAARYRAAGVNAQSVSAKTPSNVRTDFIRRFKRKEIQQLVNVDLFGEGFDVPGIEVVSCARPTNSLAVALQQWGRGLRPCEGKERALIIDHASNYKIHGLPDKRRLWSLDRLVKRSSKSRDPEDVPLTACLACFKPYERTNRCCPYCGVCPEPQGGRKAPEAVDGDLMLLDAAALAALRQATVLEAPADLASRVAAVAGPLAGKARLNSQRERVAAQKELADSIALWAGRELARGRSDPESYRRFFFWTGFDVLSALAQPTEDMMKINATIRSELAL